MEKSLFGQWVDKWFGSIVRKVVEKINGKKDGPTYLHKTMLREEYSPTLKWGSLSSNGSIVAADVVAMDSALPLKKRDKIARAEGDVPKVGMKMKLNERTLTDLDILQRMGGREAELIKKLFADVPKCIQGIDEVNEYMFLLGLSTGVTVIEDENNVGTGILVDFGHPDANKFGVVLPWTNPDAKPINDIKRVIKKAKDVDGNSLSILMMDDDTLQAFCANKQVREEFAFMNNFVGTQIPTLDQDQLSSLMSRKYKLSIQVVDRTVTFEKNGKKKTLKPWANNVIVFLNSTNVGTLTYGTLAEENHPVKSVDYQKAGSYILISKYHKNDPLEEFTSSQALVVPVIDGVDSIYFLNTEEAAIDAQTEGDVNFDYKEESYTKASVLAGIKAAKPTSKLTIASTDAKMLDAINEFSEEQIALFESKLVASA